MTKQRAAVLEVVSRKGCHYTAEEIFSEAKLLYPSMSRATVYNNLHALEKDRIIRRITAENTSDRYDSSYIPHGHLFCTECGDIKDFDIPDFVKKLSEFANSEIDSYELKVRYICNKCK